jgi:hypothetical protein
MIGGTGTSDSLRLLRNGPQLLFVLFPIPFHHTTSSLCCHLFSCTFPLLFHPRPFSPCIQSSHTLALPCFHFILLPILSYTRIRVYFSSLLSCCDVDQTQLTLVAHPRAETQRISPPTPHCHHARQSHRRCPQPLLSLSTNITLGIVPQGPRANH